MFYSKGYIFLFVYFKRFLFNAGNYRVYWNAIWLMYIKYFSILYGVAIKAVNIGEWFTNHILGFINKSNADDWNSFPVATPMKRRMVDTLIPWIKRIQKFSGAYSIFGWRERTWDDYDFE